MRAREHRGSSAGPGREAGQVVVVLVLLAAVLCVQGVVVSQVHSTTQAAVRDAARAAAESGGGRAALDARLPDWIQVERYAVSRGPHDVEVDVAVRLPLLGPSVTLDGLLVERSATFPRMDS